ncbi:MAG TPA: M48 family metallopeptidase [Ignavibacteriaceae bacterium]|nr:M48 family metallopeptidase [Ignavibacteriaceae bacterium]
MKKLKFYFIYLTIFSFFFVSCSSVPITGRKQLKLIPESEMLSMSFSQYNQFLKEHQESNNPQQVALVTQVGSKIAAAVEQYMRQNGLSDQVKNYKWEYHLVVDSEANAWCMPVGKIVVYTGILPITKDANGLAVVLGHEIAHAVAHHGDERMSQALIAQLGGVALSQALKDKPQQTQQLWMAAYGVGAEVGVLLPFSRTQESEADHLGLIFMAMAGYDPHGALDFWQRMQQLGQGSPPVFLSDHPANQTRINDIKSEMPEAMKYYKQG